MSRIWYMNLKGDLHSLSDQVNALDPDKWDLVGGVCKIDERTYIQTVKLKYPISAECKNGVCMCCKHYYVDLHQSRRCSYYGINVCFNDNACGLYEKKKEDK